MTLADALLKIALTVAGGFIVYIAKDWHADRKKHQATLESMVANQGKKLEVLAQNEASRTEAARTTAHATTLVQKALDRLAVLERDKETIFRRIDQNALASENLKADVSELRLMVSEMNNELTELNNEIGPRMAHGHG